MSLRLLASLLAALVVASSGVPSLYRRICTAGAACCLVTAPVMSPPQSALAAVTAAPQMSAISSKVDLATQLKSLQLAQDALDAQDAEFAVLPLGESYREFRAGRGSRSIEKGTPITAQMTIRCKKFTTQKEPGGVKYYDSRIDTKDGKLKWTIGDGSIAPSIEEALLGARKGSVRRIEVPSQQVFKARKDGNLPLPAPSNDDGNRRFKNLFKTDATIIIEVLVEDIQLSPGSGL